MPVFAKIIRKLTSMFAEKPQVKPDDLELEHFLVYHGLVGSGPENQREFKDVRADIKQAIDNENSLELAASLKIAPMWWEERLKTIFHEIPERDRVLAILAPDVKDDALTFDDIPLLHSVWQVRANAALALANLNAVELVEKLEHSLHDTAGGDTRTAFCHIAASLGRLGGPSSEAALAKYLTNDEAWLRVDAAAALAELSKGNPSEFVIDAMLAVHHLSDYAAVAVSKSIAPKQFFESQSDRSIAAGCIVVLELLNGSSQTFNEETVIESGAPECLHSLVQLLDRKPTCTIALTALRLAEWLEANRGYTLLSPPSQSDIEKALDFSESEACSNLIQNQMQKLSSEDSLTLTESRSAIQLAGRLGKTDVVPQLISALKKDQPLLDDSISALNRLRAQQAVQDLCRLAAELVDVEARCELPKQLHPVQEPDKKSANRYWLVLKALGQMPTLDSAKFLLKASEDHAPDKRAQALESLITAAEELDEGALKEIKQGFDNRIVSALSDPSAEVQKIALRGVATFEAVADLKKVVGLTRAREVSTQREAFDTLSELAKKGHKKDVVDTLAQALKTEPDAHKRQKLRDFIDTTQS